ncbi:hypothetical protein N825_00885 [Skermanella stibiiresistens SB22]|uniref:Uncharacterized protein n=2 Tax=Skermanella TaxID=204447 RepID=W9H8C0_9PROT|nr:hypothetical protein N825_00885 [Skermanella stibiiresistens SB22]
MELVGCRMMLIDGHVVESHVPASAVKRLLADYSAIWGNSLLGIPAGSLGMEGPRIRPLVTFGDSDEPQVFVIG